MLPSLLTLSLIMPTTDIRVVNRAGTRQIVVGETVLRSTKSAVIRPRLVRLPGRPEKIAFWAEGTESWFGISLDGTRWDQVSGGNSKLRLRYQEFDPLQSAPVIHPELAADLANELYIVQFNSQIIPAFLDLIRESGGEPLAFLANNAYICRLPASSAEQIAADKVVRWTGTYEPSYRLDPALTTTALGAGQVAGEYQVQLTNRDDAMKFQVAEHIRLIGGEAIAAPGGSFLTARLTPYQLRQIIRWNQVFWVDAASQPEDDMSLVRSAGGADVLSGLTPAYNGEGIRAEVMDGGLRSTHFDFQRAPAVQVRSNSSNMTHGTSTTGILFGSGSSDSSGKGLLPASQPIFGIYNSLAGFGGSTSRYNWTQALIAAPFNGMFQSNSWGTTPTLAYGSYSTEMDQITFDLDFLVFQSQSNTGDQTSRPQAWAKNVVSVGGINHFNTVSTGDDQWTTASIGPAADGRVKPDICHWFDSIYCPTSSSNTAYTPGFGGTSAATPITAGFAGLFLQLWSDGVFGNTISASTPFDARPHTSLTKAFMINQATQYSFSGLNDNLGRFKQGWGLSNVGNSYANRDQVFFVNEEDVLTPFQSKIYRIYVASGTPQFKATMTYLDPPGTTSSNLHRINDLSLKVTAPNGSIYYGNNGLNTATTSSSGGSPNSIDTVENVILNNPASGTWLVEVRADAINQDGRPETGPLDADFSLVVSGVNMTALATTSVMTSGGVRTGSVGDVATSNNRRLVMEKPDSQNDTAYDKISHVLTGQAPFVNPGEVRFRVEANNGEAGVSQQIELWNYVTNSWTAFDYSAIPGSGETVREVIVSANAAQYVRAADREVKARVTWWMFIINDVDWTIGADQERWFFRP